MSRPAPRAFDPRRWRRLAAGAAAGVAAALLSAGRCLADDPPDTSLPGDEAREAETTPIDAASGASSWRWTGDALLRFEAVRNAPNPTTSDFERVRLRLRPGVEGRIPSGRFAAGAGILVSSASDSNDWNMVRNDNFHSDEVAVDRAWVRFAAAEAAFSSTFGIFEVPMRSTEVLWDRDLRYQGAAAGLELPAAGALVAQRITGGVSVGSQNEEDGSRVAAVRWEGEMGHGLSVGGGYWHFGSTEDLVAAGYARTNRLAPGGVEYLSDYRVANATIGWEWIGAARPLRMRLDLLHNFGADDLSDGVEARVDWGELQELGSWRLRLFLQRVEQDATLAAFGGDEWWFRTRQRGARLGFGVGLGRRASIEFSVLRQRRDDLHDWVDRGWVDLGIAF